MDNNKKNMIRSIPAEDRPLEKLISYGPEQLTDSELLAIILRTGVRDENILEIARKLCHMKDEVYPGILGIFHASYDELISLRGIGKVKACQLLSVAEFSKRIHKARANDRLDFSSPSSVADFYMEEMRHKDREEMKLILLDIKLRKIREITISQGTVNATPASPREIFREALRLDATNIIMIHNHPSGDPTPSSQDVYITDQLEKAGELIGIRLVDHLVIGDGTYVSISQYRMIKKGMA
ncbi:MAG: DNA repair protein RadC [Clostridiales bacterium]|nr:DNA repair protein RadC [Clostridiales bacterium]